MIVLTAFSQLAEWVRRWSAVILLSGSAKSGHKMALDAQDLGPVRVLKVAQGFPEERHRPDLPKIIDIRNTIAYID